jgi:hypothetical protein
VRISNRTFKIKGKCIYVDLIRSLNENLVIVMDLETDKVFKINKNRLERLDYVTEN